MNKGAGLNPVHLRVSVATLPHFEGLTLPEYQTPDSSGMDLRAALNDRWVLGHLERALVPTGIQVAIPPGFEGQVRPRSGLAVKWGVGMVNAPGTIDADYRGEIKVLLINWGEHPVTIERGMRIAQLVVGPVARVDWVPVQDLEASGRGKGGFGHTGLS